MRAEGVREEELRGDLGWAMIWSVLSLPPALSMNKSVSHHQGELWGETRGRFVGPPDLHSAHGVTRVTSTVDRGRRSERGAWRGHSPFSLEMDIHAFVLLGLWSCWLGGKKLFKQPALSPGLRYRVADRTSPGEQISIQTPVLIKNGEIMECRLLNSKSYILFGHMKEEVTSGGSIFLISFLQ